MRIKKHAKFNRIIAMTQVAILTAFALIFGGCAERASQETLDSDEIYLYYVSEDSSSIAPFAYRAPQVDEDGLEESVYYQKLILKWIDALSGVPEDIHYKSPIENGTGVQTVTYLAGQATLDFNSAYLSTAPQTEILNRAAIVKTLMQIEGVEGIVFTVEGMPLTDSKQVPVGVMTADTFVSNPGAEINSYETTKVLVYFADEEGNMLIGRTENVGYISNISMERLVVDRVIAGPLNDKAYPTVSPTLKVLNVTTKDGICYVNLDNSFLTKTLKVSDEAVIYSFVNSLTELPNVSKVQFMIDSETEVTFGDHIYLSEPFERNLEIISTTQ